MNRGFTLVELLITVVIGMTIMNGMVYFYKNISDNFGLVRQIGSSYQANEEFITTYREFKNKYPLLLSSTGSVSFNGTGFQGVVFSNIKRTEGCFVGVLNSNSQIVTVTSNVDTYSKFTPFFVILTGSTLINATTDINTYISSMNSDIINSQKSFLIYNDIKLLKLKFSKINDSSIGKLDYTIINYDKDFYGIKVDTTGNLKDLNPYNVSIVN